MKFTITDIEKAIEYIKKHCHAEYIRLEFDERNRLLIKATDLGGSSITITVFEESTQKMAEVTRTDRL